MSKHKWHKEIKAWADGAEIEGRAIHSDGTKAEWVKIESPYWDSSAEYRIKPQPKEPQYLYVYSSDMGEPRFFWSKITPLKTDLTYQGKIKLEQDDE